VRSMTGSETVFKISVILILCCSLLILHFSKDGRLSIEGNEDGVSGGTTEGTP